MSLEEYLQEKKINAEAFKAAEPERWKEWTEIFSQMHPNSFTARQLYMINGIRRRFPHQGTSAAAPLTQKAVNKPVIKPKMG
ncbi:MAG: hypothetical protein JST14_10920 [Bacteroidetes bacterium]|nr:hypothetical protein [Bacteroidota bacterium]MBS1978860.1 hypothetical protein [Bacteroidota bacterium]